MCKDKPEGKYFISQPNGNQSFPDFLIINKKKNHIYGYPLELKRTVQELTVFLNHPIIDRCDFYYQSSW